MILPCNNSNQLLANHTSNYAESSNKKFNDSFILEFPNFYEEDYCNTIIDKFLQIEHQGFLGADPWNEEVSKSRTDVSYFNAVNEINLTQVVDVSNITAFFFQKISLALKLYKNKYGPSLRVPLVAYDMKVQRVKQGGGYHAWHYEWTPMQSSRYLVYMLYLNSIPDGEGETEFLNQGIRIKPEIGKLIMWPAQWTHTHRGNPVYSQDKYYVTGWAHVNDMDNYKLSGESNPNYEP